MTELISGAYPVIIPSLDDTADIQVALKYLHYGQEAVWTTKPDGNTSIAGYLYTIQQTLSNITSVGTIGTGTWNGSIITGAYGGTGVANTGKTITLGGNLVTESDITIDSTSAENEDVLVYDSGDSTWKPGKNRSINDIQSKTDNYTLIIGDQSDLIKVAKSTAVTVTVPKNSSVAFPLKTEINILQSGDGQVTIAPVDGDVVVRGTPGLKLRDKWSLVTLIKIDTDEWVATGDLSS